jgi:hypothetical protein
LGPVTLPLSVVPVLVLVAAPEPLTVLPRAPVAEPLAFTVAPDLVTELEAVPPRLPVTDF